MITKEEQERIEEAFKDRMKIQGVKYKSKDFYKRQVEFFSGACATLNEIPVKWGMCLMSGREIVEY